MPDIRVTDLGEMSDVAVQGGTTNQALCASDVGVFQELISLDRVFFQAASLSEVGMVGASVSVADFSSVTYDVIGFNWVIGDTAATADSGFWGPAAIDAGVGTDALFPGIFNDEQLTFSDVAFVSSATISAADAGVSRESPLVGGGQSISDSATLFDSAGTSRAIVATDNGTSTEGFSDRDVTISDFSDGTDSFRPVDADLTATEAAASREAASPDAAFALSDTGTLSESPLVSASLSSTDSGAGTATTTDRLVSQAQFSTSADSASASAAAIAATEAGSSLELPLVGASFLALEAGSIADAGLAGYGLALADTGTSSATVSRDFILFEFSTFQEATSQGISLAEAGSCTDSPLIPSPALESGSVADAAIVLILATEFSTGSDSAGSGSAGLTAIDLSFSLEFPLVGGHVVGTDAGSISAVISSTATFSTADSGTGNDSVSQGTAILGTVDSGKGADRAVVEGKILTAEDEGFGSDDCVGAPRGSLFLTTISPTQPVGG